MRSIACYILVITLWLPLRALSQNTKLLTLTEYTQNNGLSSYYITKILKDSRGFLWIGTQEGLNLFDGSRFQVFSNQSPLKHRLGGSLVSDIVEDTRQGLLWVLTSNGDVCALDIDTRVIGRRLTRDHEGKTLSESWMRCLALNNDILYIAGFNSFSAYDIRKGQYLNTERIQREFTQPGEYNISKIVCDTHGRLWVFSDGYGVVVLDKELKLIKRFPNELLSAAKQKVLFRDAIERNGQLLVASSCGLYLFGTDSEWVPKQLHEDLPSVLQKSEIRSLAFVPTGEILLSTPHRFFSYDFNLRSLQEFEDDDTESNGLSGVFQTYFDPVTDKVWIGTQVGLKCFPIGKRAFTPFSKSRRGQERLKHLYSLLPVRNERVLVGAENGTFEVNTRTKEIVKLDTGSANLMIFQDKNGNVFTSNANGVQIIRNGKLYPAYETFAELKKIVGDHLNRGVQYNDTIILFSSLLQRGIHVWNTRSHTVNTFHNDSVRHVIQGLSVINYVYRGEGADVFILTETSIVKFNPLTERYSWYKIMNKGLQEPYNFMDMCETPDSYWFATYGNGLIETDRNFTLKRVIGVREGLCNNCVYKVFNYQNNCIVATTNNGVSSVTTDRYEVKNYFQNDGLHGNGFEQLCGFQQDQKIIAGGVNGFTIIDPALFQRNTKAPSLYIQNIRIETLSGTIDTCNLALGMIEVPNDVLQLKLDFVGLNYQNPARVVYRYKLAELSSDWIDIENQNFVNLIGLGPGSYTFEAIALNEDGVASAPLKISLVYLPKWYQTIWFKIAVIASIAMLLYGIQLYRIDQLKKQQTIRKEIANDLHDDMGSTLNSLKIFSHLANREPDNKSHITQIEECVSTATLSLRDVIWVLDEDGDSVYDLMERIKKGALPVCLANNIKFESSVDAPAKSQISKKIKRNLLLIAKESINNSIKYSHGQSIQVKIHQTKKSITMTIVDDGIGFDLNKITLGRGLASIGNRAKQIRFKCDIISFPEKGTSIKVYGNN